MASNAHTSPFEPPVPPVLTEGQRIAAMSLRYESPAIGPNNLDRLVISALPYNGLLYQHIDRWSQWAQLLFGIPRITALDRIRKLLSAEPKRFWRCPESPESVRHADASQDLVKLPNRICLREIFKLGEGQWLGYHLSNPIAQRFTNVMRSAQEAYDTPVLAEYCVQQMVLVESFPPEYLHRSYISGRNLHRGNLPDIFIRVTEDGAGQPLWWASAAYPTHSVPSHSGKSPRAALAGLLKRLEKASPMVPSGTTSKYTRPATTVGEATCSTPNTQEIEKPMSNPTIQNVMVDARVGTAMMLAKQATAAARQAVLKMLPKNVYGRTAAVALRSGYADIALSYAVAQALPYIPKFPKQHVEKAQAYLRQYGWFVLTDALAEPLLKPIKEYFDSLPDLFGDALEATASG